LACAVEAGATSPARGGGGVKPGVGQGFRVASRAAVLQKRGRRPKPQLPKPPTPLGFSIPFPLCERRERRREGTPPPRHAGGTGSRPLARNRSWGKPAAVDVYLADVTPFTKPATPTPPTRCERRCIHLHFFPSSLVAFQCWTGNVEARRRDPYLACVPAFEPQTYRPATGQSSWALHAPELAVPVRGASVNTDRRAVNVFCRERGAPPCRLEPRP
jgi:hypothetical protein